MCGASFPQRLVRSGFISLLAFGLLAHGAAFADSLDAGFVNPPASAKPQTWWHWMNGNITREGITADLEAMKRVGIGGAQIFNADCGIPAGPVKFMSPEWQEMVVHAVKEADRLGLELCMHNCAGWSSSGGPWNPPEHAMQRVTFSEKEISGPSHFVGKLEQPETKLGFYRDIALLAFPAPETAGTNSASGETSPRSGLRIENINAKDGRNGDMVSPSSVAGTSSETGAISLRSIVDLTSRMKSGGRLDWKVPPGHWIILRLGYTPTGKDNHPAPAEATGPECDKLSKSGLDAHWKGFVQKVLNDLGPLAGRGKAFDNLLIDSYEVQGQNWTAAFRQEFKKRRGYDPLLYLPTFTGRAVENLQVSERFLWDIRRTIADLFAANYYGHFQELCHEHGLKASIEPYTGPFDSLQSGAAADIPMGEFWVGGTPDASVKLASSVGHIYGRPVIGAESFTAAPSREHGRWLDDPYALKALGDLVFCQGVNRYIFHRYAMQPWTNRWPGMTMGQWGTHFDRTSTWWEPGRAWLQYVARCQYLLQQGKFVADAAYFTGESAPVQMRAGDPALPFGYDYDGVGADALLRQARVKDGRLVLASGMSYRILILPPSDRSMTPDLLRRLRAFVAEGLTVVGAPPEASPSLEDYPRCDREVKRVAAELWGKCDGKTVTEHRFGKGKVTWGVPLAQVLEELGARPDFGFHSTTGTQLAFIHRSTPDAEIYFVSNQRQGYDEAECTFRVSGKTPELWNAQTGTMQPAPAWTEQSGQTTVPLQFEPAGSVFVVFRHPAPAEHLVAIERTGEAFPQVTAKRKELRILKAIYGGIGDEGFVDVTRQAKDALTRTNRVLQASNDFAEDDPAPDIVKKMRVEFRLNGETQTREVREGQTVTVPAGAELVRAVYGNLPARPVGPSEEMDVTEKLANRVKEGRVSVRADSAFAGRDPAPMLVKELRVEYSLDGVSKSIKVRENSRLTLPESGGPFGAPPPVSTGLTAASKPELVAWASSAFTLVSASGHRTELAPVSVPSPLELSGPWEVSFPPGWNAPEKLTFNQLASWTENADAGVKYFSGTATYRKEVEVPADMLSPGREIWLDLGRVKNLAEVSVNGTSLGILWKPPFRVNATRALKPGGNRLEVKITNLWPNRLIGDEQLPPDREWKGKELKGWPQWLLEGKPSPTGRLTFTTWHHWTKDEPLLESGLLGPVRLLVAQEVPLGK